MCVKTISAFVGFVARNDLLYMLPLSHKGVMNVFSNVRTRVKGRIIF
jgi:hypothetical protein